MNPSRIFRVSCTRSIVRAAAPVAAALLLFGAQGAMAQPSDGSQRTAAAACGSNRYEDPAACQREARNATADIQRGRIGSTTADQLAANRIQRCSPLTGEDKAACEARVSGLGASSGSVSSGGVLKEVETVVLPAGGGPVRVEPRTESPVYLVPEGTQVPPAR